MTCRNCGWRDAKRHGRCDACGDYKRRTGEERPARLILRHLERVNDRRHLQR